MARSSDQVPVLVVGAGPVGLCAAITLREQGARVRIVDEHPPETKRSYPVVLHARTLRILDRLGVTSALEWQGHTVKQLAVYSTAQHQATLDLPTAPPVAAGAMTLPQDVLRRALMQRLSDLGTDIEWQTRLESLEQDAARAHAVLARREPRPGDSYAVEPEWVSVGAEPLSADFIIGADGCRSSVRKLLGIDWLAREDSRFYHFYDAPDSGADAQAHLVIADGSCSSIYPLRNDLSRFSFEVGEAVAATRAPSLAHLQRLLRERMPWFRGEASQLEWCGSAEFTPAIASRFGEGRVWLAGDAAHSTVPLGAQSLNVGIHEAHDLARRMAFQLSSSGETKLGVAYTAERRSEWERLFGAGSSRPFTELAPAWVRREMMALLPSLPAGGDDLDDLLDQLHVRTA